MSPFFANYSFHPCFLAESNPSPNSPSSSHSASAAEEFASYLHEIHERLMQNVKHAQDLQAKYYDAKHKPVQFKPGDLVWLNSSNISTMRPLKKLDWKRHGPFKVVKHVGLQAYKLALPASMRHIHDTFHISLLDPAKSSPWSGARAAWNFRISRARRVNKTEDLFLRDSYLIPCKPYPKRLPRHHQYLDVLPLHPSLL